MSDASAAAPAAVAAGRAWPDRVIAALPLAIVFTWLFFLYVWQSWGHITPWLFSDELQTAQLSRAIAATGHPARRGEPYGFQSLYNYVIAPVWWIHNTHTAYSVLKVVGCFVMTSALFPAYALARLVVAPRYALFAAAGTAAIPALIYSSMLIPEPAAYFWSTLCFYLMAKALLTRRPGWVAAAVVATLMAPLVRKQLTMIPFAFLLAAIFLALTGERARQWRSRWTRWDWIGAVVLGAGTLIVFNAAAAAHSHEWLVATGFYRHRMIVYGLWAAGALMIGLGVLPVVVGLAALFRRRGERRTEAERVFTAVFAGGLIGIGWYTAVKASYVSTVFSTLVEERNLIYVAPLLFVATAIWLERPRVRWWALAASAGLALYLILNTPYKMEFHFYSDAPGLGILQEANRHLGWTPHTARLVLLSMLAISVVLVLLPRFLGERRRAAAAVVGVAAVGVLGWTITAQISAASASNSFADAFAANIAPPLDWIDKATHGKPTLYLGQSIVDSTGFLIMEFWNRSIKDVWSLDGTAPGPGPTLTPDLAGADGRLYPSPKGVIYAMTDPGVDVVGTVVATHDHNNGGSVLKWTLVKIAQPLRLAHAQTGIEPDAWVASPDGVKPAKAAYNQYVTTGKRPGFASVTVSRRGWGGTDVPGLVTVKLGTLVKGKEKQPALGKVLAVRRFWIHSREERRFFIPAPRGPFRVEVTVNPTFVQSQLDPRIGDTRHLGAQVGFGWVPRIPRR